MTSVRVRRKSRFHFFFTLISAPPYKRNSAISPSAVIKRTVTSAVPAMTARLQSIFRTSGLRPLFCEFLKPFCHFHTHHLRTKDIITGSCMLPTVDCCLSTTGCGYVLHSFLQSPGQLFAPVFPGKIDGAASSKSP